MNENSANADGIGSMQHAFGAVAEQGAAEALPFVAVVDGEAAENDDRNRFGHVAAEVARRRGCFDAARREGVIADNFRAFTGHEGAGGVGRLIFGGTAFQPIVEGRNTGREFSDLMTIGEGFRSGDRHA